MPDAYVYGSMSDVDDERDSDAERVVTDASCNQNYRHNLS